jgi:hypothetical protein
MAIDRPERAAKGRLPTGELRGPSDDPLEVSCPDHAADLELRTASEQLRKHSRVLREHSRELREYARELRARRVDVER